MTTTDDPEKFRRAWNEHIDELNGLKHSLHPNYWPHLEAAQDDLRDLVEQAAEKFEDGP